MIAVKRTVLPCLSVTEVPKSYSCGLILDVHFVAKIQISGYSLIWSDMVHDLDQETKGVLVVLKTLYTKPDRRRNSPDYPISPEGA